MTDNTDKPRDDRADDTKPEPTVNQDDDRQSAAPTGNEEHEEGALEEASERMLLRKDRT